MSGDRVNWEIRQGDCITGMADLEEASVDLTVTSIPFGALFMYSGKTEDIGNNEDGVDLARSFFGCHLRFWAEQLHRVTRPGCLAAIHIQQLVTYAVQHGYQGRRDLRGATVDVLTAAGFEWHAEFTIPKNPQVIAQRQKLHSLLFATGYRDSRKLAPAVNDHCLIFRRPGEAPPVPALYHEHKIEITAEQLAAMQELLTSSGKGLFDTSYGVRERSKLAQIARGFLYEGTGPERTARAIASRKPGRVVGIVDAEADAGRPTIVWTNFDEESEMLGGLIRERRDDLKVAELSGATSEADAHEIIHSFRREDTDVLITKPQLVGYGLNFQRCKAMVFSGLDDSFERRYQAVRRAYRLGQTDPVHVHIPHVPELEGLMVENVAAKEARFEADVEQAQRNYVKAVQPSARGRR